MGQPSDELVEKILSVLHERQQSINKQMEASEKKFLQQAEANRLLQEKVERKFFDQLEENRFLMEKSERKYFDQLEEKGRQHEEIWGKIYKELETSRIKRDEPEKPDKHPKKTKQHKNKLPNYHVEMAAHPIYFAIIKLFSERGYDIDSDTLKMYWELVTSITRSQEHQND